VFAPADSWVWDFWLADDGQQYHLFFLFASKALPDPNHRHHRASVGHAISTDLVGWTRVRDALVRDDGPAFDDVATWTGSVIRAPDGTWRMFYTGGSTTELGFVQTVGYATSPDLMRWTKHPGNPVARADGIWYETIADSKWHDEAFRDPWVFADPEGAGWHMLITARANDGPDDDRGVVGHAWSTDLVTWELRPPLSRSGQGFGQLEVTQAEIVDEQPVLLFSCLARDMAKRRRAGTTGGVWAAPGKTLCGPWDIANAQQLSDNSLYSGRLIRDRAGAWQFLAFLYDDPDGSFRGEISDPAPIHWDGARLVIDPCRT
jgi:beta-fructofuranosidase